MIGFIVEGHDCNKSTERDSIEYDEDRFGDFIDFKKELKTNLTFLLEVSNTYLNLRHLELYLKTEF